MSNTKIFDVIITLLLTFLIIFTPLAYGTVEVWSVWIMQTAIALMTLFFILSLSRQKQIISTYLYIPIILFILLILIQIIPMPKTILKLISPTAYNIYSSVISPIKQWAWNSLSLNSYATYIELLKVISYALLFFVIINTIKSGKDIEKIFYIIIITGFIISFFAIIQKYAGAQKIYWLRSRTRGGGLFGPFVNRDHFAGYISMVIPLGLSLLFILGKTEKKILLGFTIVIMIIALIYSVSRGGVLSFLGSMIFFSFLLFKYRKKDKNKIYYLGAIILTAVIFLFWLKVAPEMDRLSKIAASERYTLDPRIPVWKDSLGMIKDYPVFGTGLGTYEYAFQRYRTHDMDSYFRNAHNDYLQVLTGTGITGFLIILSFFIIYFKYILKTLNNVSKYNNFYLCIGGLSSVASILLHSFVDFNLRLPGNAFLFITILALTYSSSRQNNNTMDIKINKSFIITSGIILIAIYSIFITKNYIANINFKNSDFKKAVDRSPDNPRYRHRLGLRYQKLASQPDISYNKKINLLLKAEKQLEKSIILNPSYGRYLASYAWLMGNIGEKNRALKYFNLAQEYYKDNEYIKNLKKRYIKRIEE
ncbi:MAG: O-antigen ligase family protein [Atribacterota bacterium]